MDEMRRQDLAQFLRERREGMDRATAPGGANPRRRAPGWLREELADLAGISATWVMWLEQGREVRASGRTITRLADALELSLDERAYFFRLARPDLALDTMQFARSGPSERLIKLLDSVAPMPAYAFDQNWNVVAVNAPARALFGGWDLSDPIEGNLMRRLFQDPRMRILMRNWDGVARNCTGHFKAMAAGRLRDPHLLTLLEALRGQGRDFAALWRENEAIGSYYSEKCFDHPDLGALAYECSVVRCEGHDSAFWVSIYLAKDEETRRKSGALVADGARGVVHCGPEGL